MTVTFTAEVGRKFNVDGTARPFAGTTIIAFVDVDEPIYRVGAWLQEQMRQRSFGHKFSYLPLSSLHMTVIQLLNDQDRAPDRWTPLLPLDASLAEICTLMASQVASIRLPTKLVMRCVGIKRTGNVALQLEPATVTIAQMLRHYRDAVATATGVRLPNHERYQFHISLAYRLIELTAIEQQQLEALFDAAEIQVDSVAPNVTLPPPHCTVFSDMLQFLPIDQYRSACV